MEWGPDCRGLAASFKMNPSNVPWKLMDVFFSEGQLGDSVWRGAQAPYDITRQGVNAD